MKLVNLFAFGKPEENKQLIKMMIRYKKQAGSSDGFTQGVWFSRDEIDQIRRLMDTEVPPGKTGDGVRFYIGKYHKKQKGFENRISVACIATYEEIDSHGKPFHEDAVDDKEIDDAKIEIGAGDIDPIPLIQLVGDGFNHGQLCPPNCGKIAAKI